MRVGRSAALFSFGKKWKTTAWVNSVQNAASAGFPGAPQVASASVARRPRSTLLSGRSPLRIPAARVRSQAAASTGVWTGHSRRVSAAGILRSRHRPRHRRRHWCRRWRRWAALLDAGELFAVELRGSSPVKAALCAIPL